MCNVLNQQLRRGSTFYLHIISASTIALLTFMRGLSPPGSLSSIILYSINKGGAVNYNYAVAQVPVVYPCSHIMQEWKINTDYPWINIKI